MNVERFNEVLEVIRNNPEGWDQRVWGAKRECGTACCIAGWVVQLDGGELKFDFEANDEFTRQPMALAYDAKMPNGEDVNIQAYATKAFDLDEETGWAIFSPQNDTIEKLENARDLVLYYEEHGTWPNDDDEV